MTPAFLYPEALSPPVDLDLPRVLVGLGFLVVAAGMDWRKRLVKDEVWVAMGAVALALVEVDLVGSGAPWPLHLVTAATAILFFAVFFGKELWDDEGFHFRIGRILAFLLVPLLLVAAFALEDPGWFDAYVRLLTMPAMILVAHALYYVGALRGGADAKAVMALALLVPGVYPHLGGFPILTPPPYAAPALALFFPFAFVVLVNAAILVLVVPIALLVRNAAKGDAKLPRALFGYPVPIDGIPRYAWLMDRIEDGKPVHVYMPRRKEDREEQVRLLREHGFTRVWVTPQLPFVVALLLGYGLAVVVGNVLLALFGLAR